MLDMDDPDVLHYLENLPDNSSVNLEDYTTALDNFMQVLDNSHCTSWDQYDDDTESDQ